MPRDESSPLPVTCPYCGITAARCIPACLWAEPPGTVVWGRGTVHTVRCGGCQREFEHRMGEER